MEELTAAEEGEKAIDEGFDYVNYPNLTPEEQIETIPVYMM